MVVSTSIAGHFKSSSSQSPKTYLESNFTKEFPHSNATGSLMHAMICTRPDLAYATSLVSRYMEIQERNIG